MNTPEFVCNQTPWVSWYLPPSAEQSKTTSTSCSGCGGRRLLPYRKGWQPMTYWTVHRKIEVNRAYIQWVRNNRDWKLFNAEVNGSWDECDAKQARRPHHAELDPKLLRGQQVDDHSSGEPQIIQWDWDFGQPARGPRLMYAEDTELVKLYAKGVLRNDECEWGQSLKSDPRMEDIEGSYIVRYRTPKKRRSTRERALPREAHQDTIDVEYHAETISECTDDSFGLISMSTLGI
jgi:hypothetical protein